MAFPHLETSEMWQVTSEIRQVQQRHERSVQGKGLGASGDQPVVIVIIVINHHE